MLEKNFDELDNDFITVWSHFFTDDKVEYNGKLKEAIEYLSEMGQINAIQCHYLYYREGYKHNIDLVANHYIKNKDGFNIDYVKAHKSCTLLKDLQDKINDVISESKRYFRFKYGVEVFGSEKVVRDDLRFRFGNLDYYKYSIRAIERAKNDWLTGGNVLAGERMVEMMSGLSHDWPLAEDRGKIRKKMITYARQIRKQLWVEFAKCNWSVDEFIKQKPEYAYALGKNLVGKGLSRWFDIDQKKRKIGKEIILKLASRDMSPIFIEYSAERKNEEKFGRQQEAQDFFEHFMATEGTPENMSKISREMDGITDYSILGTEDNVYLGEHEDGLDGIDEKIDEAVEGFRKRHKDFQISINEEDSHDEKIASYTSEELGISYPFNADDGEKEASRHLKIVNEWTKDI